MLCSPAGDQLSGAHVSSPLLFERQVGLQVIKPWAGAELHSRLQLCDGGTGELVCEILLCRQPQRHEKGCDGCSGSRCLHGLVAGLLHAAGEAPLRLQECGGNENKALSICVHAPNHLAAIEVLDLVQMKSSQKKKSWFSEKKGLWWAFDNAFCLLFTET